MLTRLRSAALSGAFVIATACGGDSSGPAALTDAQVTGTWDLVATGCLNGNLPVRLSASSDGSLTSALNTWTNSESLGFFRPLDGSVNLETGATEFHMWADGDKQEALLFTGTMTAAGELDGNFTDPMPGFGPIFHFSGGAICTAAASGHKR